VVKGAEGSRKVNSNCHERDSDCLIRKVNSDCHGEMKFNLFTRAKGRNERGITVSVYTNYLSAVDKSASYVKVMKTSTYLVART